MSFLNFNEPSVLIKHVKKNLLYIFVRKTVGHNNLSNLHLVEKQYEIH